MSRNKVGATHSLAQSLRHAIRIAPAALALLFTALAASNTIAATGDVAFGIRPSYNNVPDLANPGAFDSDVVVYSLPASGFYSGPRQSYFDVFARVDGGGSRQASGFGTIVISAGSGELTFAVLPIDPSSANNLPNSKNPDYIHNAAITEFLAGNLNPDGFPAAGQSVGVIGLHETANADVMVTHGDGLFAMPIKVAAGFQGQVAITIPNNPTLVGFSDKNGNVITNVSSFPHQGATVEVRAAVRGDFNGDLLVNAQDWSGFNAARSNLGAFQAQYPWLPALYAGDFNEDGAISALDVPAFQQLAGVPEPSTIALAIAAAAPLLLMRRRSTPR